jgi:hypothetical protein
VKEVTHFVPFYSAFGTIYACYACLPLIDRQVSLFANLFVKSGFPLRYDYDPKKDG